MLEYKYDVISLSHLELFSEITNWVYSAGITKENEKLYSMVFKE